MARRVGERFAWADGELLLFPHGHDLLGNWRTKSQRDKNRLFVNAFDMKHDSVTGGMGNEVIRDEEFHVL